MGRALTTDRNGLKTCLRSLDLGRDVPQPDDLGSDCMRQYLFILTGSGHADINGWQTALGPGEILFIPCGAQVQFDFPHPCKAFLFGVNEDFLISQVIPALGVSLASHWDDFYNPKKLSQWTSDCDAPERERIWMELQFASRRIGSSTDAVAAGYVMLILFERNNRAAREKSAAGSPAEFAADQIPQAAHTLLARFRGLIEKQMECTWSVAEYCHVLNVRPTELAAACRDLTGHTPGSLIQQHKLQRAMRELRTTDASAAEVGYRLGFDDPAYFSRFFRKHTGRSPLAFRREGGPVKNEETGHLAEVNARSGSAHPIS